MGTHFQMSSIDALWVGCLWRGMWINIGFYINAMILIGLPKIEDFLKSHLWIECLPQITYVLRLISMTDFQRIFLGPSDNNLCFSKKKKPFLTKHYGFRNKNDFNILKKNFPDLLGIFGENPRICWGYFSRTPWEKLSTFKKQLKDQKSWLITHFFQDFLTKKLWIFKQYCPPDLQTKILIFKETSR